MNTEKLYLLPKTDRIYKANTHCHSTVSDGRLTPEEVKAAYKAHGYQILALTDHEICVPHPELNDEDFLTLTSYEIAVNMDVPNRPELKTYHFCLISKGPDCKSLVFYDERYMGIAHWDGEPTILSSGHRDYSLENANRVIREANEAGFLVCYNHPNWSQQNYSDYIGLKGLWGVEVHNNACIVLGYDESTPRPFEDLVRAGQGLFPVAADDAHNHADCFGGWLMVAAKSLTYGDVIAALEHGDFYASTGPEIHSLTLENGKLRVTSSPCTCIRVATQMRPCYPVFAAGEELLTEAEFDLNNWFEKAGDNGYFRVTLEDAAGKHAYTRVFTRDEVAAAFCKE